MTSVNASTSIHIALFCVLNQDCRSSVCTKIGWEQCFLEAPADDKNYDKGNLCYVSCQSKCHIFVHMIPIHNFVTCTSNTSELVTNSVFQVIVNIVGPGTTDSSGCISTGDLDALKRNENSDLQGLLDDLGQESIKLKPGLTFY